MSLVLRRESLRVEMELQLYRTHMDELVEARVRELDEAHARLGRGVAGAARHGGGAAPQGRGTRRPARAWRRSSRGAPRSAEALDEATSAIAGLFKARYVRVRLLTDGEAALEAAACLDAAVPPAAGDGHAAGRRRGPGRSPTWTWPSPTRSMADCVMVAEDVADWPGLPETVRRQAQADGVRHGPGRAPGGDLRPGGGAGHRPGRRRQPLHRGGAPAGAHRSARRSPR